MPFRFPTLPLGKFLQGVEGGEFSYFVISKKAKYLTMRERYFYALFEFILSHNGVKYFVEKQPFYKGQAKLQG